MEKIVKSLSDLVSEVLYENCCKGKICSKCKYDTRKVDCHISMIVKIIQEYEKENEI